MEIVLNRMDLLTCPTCEIHGIHKTCYPPLSCPLSLRRTPDTVRKGEKRPVAFPIRKPQQCYSSSSSSRRAIAWYFAAQMHLDDTSRTPSFEQKGRFCRTLTERIPPQ